MPTAVALVSDLVMRSHVAAAAQRTSVAVDIVASSEALLARLSETRPALVILDLSHPGIDPRGLVPRIVELLPAEGQVLAFGPHVHAERLSAAAEAGCNIVISRGQFHAQVDAILAPINRER